jgi:hopene-associated glycosyltransferase HpnB
MTALVVASLACAAWVYLLIFRGGFWRAAERDDGADVVPPAAWPRVIAVVPARNEASVIAASITSLLRQDYRGEFEIIMVDDHSTDGTATIARDAAAATADRLTVRLVVMSAPNLPDGWTGKLWAMSCGARHADGLPQPPDYLLFTDADISYAPETLTGIVTRAQRDELVLVSLMAKLHCESVAERALIPAFIFFFRLLYPFAWVNRPERATAAAAGGCMLIRRDALQSAGGIASIRGELIDDCALARILKVRGPIWLGLTERARSLRAFRSLADIRPMISRCAYAQLRYSPWLLIGTALAIAVTCLAPPLMTVGGTGTARWLGAAAWALMALVFQPTLRFYGVSRWWGPTLPAIAAVYLAFTLDSAYQHWRGRGGLWKGRVHAPVPDRR